MNFKPADITRFTIIENNLRNQVCRTFPKNSASRDDFKKWQKACQNLYTFHSPLHQIWTQEFKSSVISGNRESIESLITYLEADPYYFRSGYLKSRLVRIIKKAPLTAKDEQRLRSVIWNKTAKRSGQEFREYCRLATLVSTPTFREKVAKKAVSIEHKKFKFLLKYLSP